MFSWFKKKQKRRVDFAEPAPKVDTQELIQAMKTLERRNAEMLMIIGVLQTENVINTHYISALAKNMSEYLDNPNPDQAQKILAVIQEIKEILK